MAAGWTVPWIWVMLLANASSGLFVMVGLVFFLYKVNTDEDLKGNKCTKLPIVFQVIMSIFAVISCVAYGFGRPNIFVDIHSPGYCYMIYCLSLFSWAIGRYFTLLSFLFRIWIAFSQSALAYPVWFLVALGVFLTIAAASVCTLLALTSVPDIVVADGNDTVTICMSADTNEMSLAKYSAQAIDFGLTILFLAMFVVKLNKIRNLNKEDRHKRRQQHSHRDIVNAMPSKKNKSKKELELTVPSQDDEEKQVESPPSPQRVTSTSATPDTDRKVSFAARLKNANKLHKTNQSRSQTSQLETLMMKQTILVFIVVLSTWFSLGWSIFDPRFSLFLGVDAMVNTTCSLFVFKYTYRFWNMCLHCCRCYCCYACCVALFGCFPCDAPCCSCCDDLVHRVGTTVRSLRTLSMPSNSNNNARQLEENMSNNSSI